MSHIADSTKPLLPFQRRSHIAPAGIGGHRVMSLIAMVGLALTAGPAWADPPQSDDAAVHDHREPSRHRRDDHRRDDHRRDDHRRDDHHRDRYEFATLPAGTRVTVRLMQELDSDDVHNGDRFSAEIVYPLYDDGDPIVPAGSRVDGQILHVKDSGEVRGRAEMTIALRWIELDGERRPFETYPLVFRAHGTKKDDAAKIAGGAAVGAIIGALLDGDDGAAKGAAIGGGSGIGYVLLTEGEDVELDAGSRLSFELATRAVVPDR